MSASRRRNQTPDYEWLQFVSFIKGRITAVRRLLYINPSARLLHAF
jgi:hypothetical protein